MVSLSQLEVLVAVVEAGGFSGAAKTMYMSQPSVSNHVRNLEGALGVSLLERTPQGSRTTPAGDVVVEHARRILRELDSLRHQVADFQGLGAGRLVVAGTTSLGTYLLPRLVARFAALAPNVECQVRVGNEEAVEGWLMRGEVALGVCVGEPREHLASEALFTERMVLVAAPGSDLAGRRLTPSDLSGQRFLLRERGSATRRQQEATLQAWGLEGVSRWELWGLETLKEGAADGLGLALLSEHATARERGAGLLAELEVDPAPAGRTVTLVSRADRAFTPPEQTFVAQLREIASWPT